MLSRLLASLALLTACNTSNAPLRIQLGSKGDLLAWLVAGPYDNTGALELKGKGFRTDYLQTEVAAQPKEGDLKNGFTWRFATATISGGLDIKALLRTEDPGIAYCYTALESPVAQDAQLWFGSDDGAKVWLNGRQVFEKQVARGVVRDEDKVPIHLQAGMNRLLFKIEQGNGGWGLMARLVDPSGKPLRNVVQAVELDKGPEPYRALEGNTTAFDLAAYQQFTDTRDTALEFLDRMRKRADRPERLESALNQATQALQNAASDTSVYNAALRQGEQNIKRAYNSSRAKLVAWAQSDQPLFAADPKKEDFIKVMPGGRYFVHANGKPFIPVGYNHNTDWPELEQSNPLRKDYDPARTDRWFKNLADHGVNVVRIMVETPQSGNLEKPLGVRRPEHLIWLDHIVTAARNHNVRLWVTPYDTFWMNLRADKSPYWKANGGPIDKPVDFLTKRAVIDLQKKRLKFLIDRYGNTGTIFAWEIMNEIDLWWKASPQQIRAWTDEMVHFVRSYQRQRWGRDHLVTVSFGDPLPKGLNADTAFRHPALDFATMHLYLGASRGPKPEQTEQAGVDFASGVTYARHQVRDNRPVLDGESGPIDKWIREATIDDEVFRQMSWQHLMAGGAGPGTRWPYRNPHHLTPGMLNELKAIRAFCDDVPWKQLTGPAVEVKCMGPAAGKSSVVATERAAIAWLRIPKDLPQRQFALYFPEPARPATFRMFAVKTGNWIGDVHHSTDKDGIRVLVPPGVEEIALWITR